jgi:hypothetical protein
MIKKHNNTSIALGLPGFLVQAAGVFLMAFRPEHAEVGVALALVGAVLLMVGLAYYAMAKGRHPAWCLVVLLLALLGQFVSVLLAPILTLLGYAVLGLLKDYSDEAQSATEADVVRALRDDVRRSQRVAPRPAPSASATTGAIGGPATFQDPAPGHDFNANGVCRKCGCGRSAAHRPCTS